MDEGWFRERKYYERKDREMTGKEVDAERRLEKFGPLVDPFVTLKLPHALAISSTAAI